MAHIYNVISVICIVLFFISLLITGILFYSLKVNKIIAELTGYAGRKYVKKQIAKRENKDKKDKNEKIENTDRVEQLTKVSPVNNEKNFDFFAASKDIIIKHVAGGFYTGDTTKLSDDNEKTTVLKTEELEKTVLLKTEELEKTTVLKTEELNAAISTNEDEEKTAVLLESQLDRANFVEDITSVLSDEDFEKNSDDYGATEVLFDGRSEEINKTERLIITKELVVIHTDIELLRQI